MEWIKSSVGWPLTTSHDKKYVVWNGKFEQLAIWLGDIKCPGACCFYTPGETRINPNTVLKWLEIPSPTE